MRMRILLCLLVLAVSLGLLRITSTAQNRIMWTNEEKPILQQLQTLRSLPDDVRAKTTQDLALRIRRLPAGDHKAMLANDLANLSTEGDFGRDTLQEVTTTLATALNEHAVPEENGGPAMPYVELAQLVRYEHMQASSDSAQFSGAMERLESADKRREEADFTLTDITGQNWTLSELRGKVVV